MKDVLAKLGVLAQGSGGEDWVNILILAVVAFFWLIGAIAKTIGKKGPATPSTTKVEPRPRATWQERLARKVEEMQRAAEAQSGATSHRVEEVGSLEQERQPPPVREPGGKITVRTGPRSESVMVYERPQPQVPAAREQQAARQQQVRRAVAATGRAATKNAPAAKLKVEAAAPTFTPIAPERSGVASEPSQPTTPVVIPPSVGVQPSAVIDPTDPDALRKAILHYEILGKPIALRQPSEQTIGF